MGKTKHAKDDEFHKQIIRNLRKENRRLQQRIKQLEKFQNNIEEEKEEPIEKLPKCDQCGKGFLKEVDFVGRLFVICNVCKFRKKL